MNDFKQQPVPQQILDRETQQRLDPGGVRGFLNSVVTFLSANRYATIAILLGVVVIGVLAYFAFRPHKQVVTEAKVTVSIDAPETAPSGGEVVYKVKIENQDSNTLTGMELELVYPPNASYSNSTPPASNLSGTLFPVPDLQSGQNAVVIVKIRLQGNINDTQKLLARLHYRYSNFNSDFIKEAEAETRLIASDVTLTLSGPNSTNNSQIVEYQLQYQNDSDRDIENARMQFQYPEGFTYAASTPAPDLGRNIWALGRLQKGQQGTITVQGSYRDAQPGQAKIMTASLLVLDSSGNYYTQASTSYTTTISSLPLSVTQSLGSQYSDGIAKPGATLDYTIKYQNNGTVVAKGVNIVATLDSKVLDLASIQTQGAEINNNTITWNASGVPNLERLSPTDSGTVSFRVKIKNPPVKDSSTNLQVVSSVKIKSDEYESFLPGNDITVKIATVSSLDAQVEYVSGALPPQVGKTTTYRITLSAKNSTNDLKDAVLSGFVPLRPNAFDASSVPAKEAGSVTYDQSTGKVTWRAGLIAAHTGDFNPVRKLSFTVQINPSADKAGKDIVLFKNIVLNTTDAFTDQAIKLTADDLSTRNIPNGGSKGIVVK